MVSRSLGIRADSVRQELSSNLKDAFIRGIVSFTSDLWTDDPVWNYGVIGKILTSPNANINAYIRFYNVERIEKCYCHFPWINISCLHKVSKFCIKFEIFISEKPQKSIVSQRCYI